jgi:hypothetical protein
MMVWERLKLALSNGPNRVGVSLPSPEEGNNPVSETLGFLDGYNSGRWTKSINSVILSVIIDFFLMISKAILMNDIILADNCRRFAQFSEITSMYTSCLRVRVRESESHCD